MINIVLWDADGTLLDFIEESDRKSCFWQSESNS